MCNTFCPTFPYLTPVNNSNVWKKLGTEYCISDFLIKFKHMVILANEI